MAESLRLQGKDREAAALVALYVSQVSREVAAAVGDEQQVMHLALLEAFGGDGQAALKSVVSELSQLEKPVDHWTEADGNYSADIAAVLAWSGQKQKAIDILTKSMDAPFGAHAAIVARDPVWRPLYKEPAFVALLAAHGQQLAYAK
jgi:hypothetical protein